jgi:hypothetical protein
VLRFIILQRTDTDHNGTFVMQSIVNRKQQTQPIYSQYSLDELQQYTKFMTAFYTVVNQSGNLELRCPLWYTVLVHTTANFGYAVCVTDCCGGTPHRSYRMYLGGGGVITFRLAEFL